MRVKIFALICIVAVFSAFWVYDLQQQPIPQQSIVFVEQNVHLQMAPNISFTTLAGQKFEGLEVLTEPMVLINFWASWCVPCLVEIPALLELVKKEQGRIAVVFVSIDDTRAPMDAFIRRQGLTSAPEHTYWVWDEGKELSLKSFNVLRVPETFVLNDKRQIVTKVAGEIPWQKQRYNKLLVNDVVYE